MLNLRSRFRSITRLRVDCLTGRRPGQAIVEAALLTPLMLVLLIGTVDVGRLFYYDITVQNAVREGARRAIDVTRTDSEIQNSVTSAAPGITLTGISVTPSTRTSTTTGTVSVSATYSFTPWTPGVSSMLGSSVSVTRAASMLIL